MSELKECPFCGKKPCAEKFEGKLYAQCVNVDCVYAGGDFSPIETWNTRPIEDSLRAKCERLQLALECYATANWGWDSEDRPYIDYWDECADKLDPHVNRHKDGGYIARTALESEEKI